MYLVDKIVIVEFNCIYVHVFLMLFLNYFSNIYIYTYVMHIYEIKNK